MRCRAKSLGLLAVILVVGGLATGCSTAQSALSNLPSRTATGTAAPTDTGTAGPTGTAAPTTAAPTTAAPTTAAPTTATTGLTASQSTPSATKPAAAPSATPSAGSGTGLLWLWLLLGALVLIGLIVWITYAARRRKAATADWRSRIIDAYAKGSALHDAMIVAETPNGAAAGDAAARWFDIQRRADDFAQVLYTLRETVPDPGDSARVADTLVSLQAVRSAMDAERAPGGAGPYQAEVVRGRLSAFELSLRALRARNNEAVP